jgi:RNA polymerase sigma-70 factor, ECF subfamily
MAPAAGIAALVVRARGGDTSAFEELLKTHEQLVLRTAVRILGRREDARDAAQEVFLRLYRNLNRIREDTDLRPWLYTVTVNVCRSMERKRSRLPVTALESDDYPAAGPDGVESIDAERRRRWVGAAIGRLTEAERTAVVLRDIEGLSSEQAGEVLGRSAATIRSQIASARSKIRNFCERALRGSG